MRLAFRLVLILVLISVLSGCQTKAKIENATLSKSTIAEAAYKTYSSCVRAIHDGKENSSSLEIPEQYWAQAIRELKPINVYTHRVNLVVVQKVHNNVEEGKYIYIPVSSYLPMDGIDGFTYKPNPLKDNQYHFGEGVFDYQRTIKN